MGDFILHPDYQYQENLIKVEVYYEAFNFEQNSESPTYTVSNVFLCVIVPLVMLANIELMLTFISLQPTMMFSKVGGSFGLWCGFSLLTLAELAEFWVDMLGLAFFFLFRKTVRNSDKNKLPPEKYICDKTYNEKNENASADCFGAPYFLSQETDELDACEEDNFADFENQEDKLT